MRTYTSVRSRLFKIKLPTALFYYIYKKKIYRERERESTSSRAYLSTIEREIIKLQSRNFLVSYQRARERFA